MSFFALSAFLFSISQSWAIAETHEIPLDAVMAPAFGYDNNDRIEIVVHGELPSACHTLGRTEAIFEKTKKQFKIKQFVIRKRDGLCAEDRTIPKQMLVRLPFTAQYQLDERHIDVGTYELSYVNSKGNEVKRPLLITAAEATTTDEVPYATVSSVLTSPVLSPGETAKVTISGMTTSSCFTRNPVTVEPAVGDVYVIKPTVTFDKDRMCIQVLKSFEETVELPGVPTPGHHLVHVRSTGRSVNQVFEVRRD
jgi:hypothetical protein